MFNLESLPLGIILGMVAGLSPGPMLILTVTETLKYGKKEGFKVAVSPLITDSTIILTTLLALSTFARHTHAIGLISIFGAFYLIYLGLENFRNKKDRFKIAVKKEALKLGIVTNLLNPNTYLFWISVGDPIILKALENDASAIIPFLLGFYAFLIGSMMSVVLLVDKSKTFDKSKHYSYIIRILGIFLIFFALTFLIEGLRLVAII